MNKKYMLFGVSATPLTFTNVVIGKHNTREITFTGKYNGVNIAVNNLKPSGLLFLDMTGENAEAPVGQAPVGQAPVGQAPVGQAPVGQAPVGQAPVGQAPVGQAPVGQAPVGQAPVGQAPVDTPPAPVDTPPAPVDTPPAPVDTPPAPVGQAPTPVTREQVFEFGTQAYNSGKDVMGKVLVPLGYKQLAEVPDEKLQEVYDILANDATWVQL